MKRFILFIVFIIAGCTNPAETQEENHEIQLFYESLPRDTVNQVWVKTNSNISNDYYTGFLTIVSNHLYRYILKTGNKILADDSAYVAGIMLCKELAEITSTAPGAPQGNMIWWKGLNITDKITRSPDFSEIETIKIYNEKLYIKYYGRISAWLGHGPGYGEYDTKTETLRLEADWL